VIALTSDACTGCGDCAKICPHAVFEMRERKAVPVHEERCVECGACELNCHDGAIRVTKGTGCVVTIIKEDILGIRDSTCC